MSVPLRAWLVLSLLLPAGCSSFHSPTVSVQDAAMTQATDEALGASLLLELRNPNPKPLELYEFRYTLKVDGTEVYKGRRAAGATIGASGTRTVALPAVIVYERLGWAKDGLPQAAEYELEGELKYMAPQKLLQVLLGAGMHRPGVSFSQRGELRLK